MTRQCRSCFAPILWGRTGLTFIPLDADPDPRGNVVPTGARHPSGAPIVDVLGPLELQLLDDDAVRYMPHHATCQDAAAWKSKGNRKARR